MAKCDELPEQQRLRLRGMIMDDIPWRQIGAEFDIPESTVRAWARAQNITRNDTAAKRVMVDALLRSDRVEEMESPLDTASDEQITTGNDVVDCAAFRDAKVSKLASIVAKRIIEGLEKVLDSGDLTARDFHSMAMALDKANGTYARINKLDDAPVEKTVIKWVVSD